MSSVEERRLAILNTIVEEYIDTAQPVSSVHVAQIAQLNVSPATVRSDMAILDREGFLVQPHTSAGRTPTERGYRFYVDHLDRPGTLFPDQRHTLQKFFSHLHGEVDQLLERSANLIARLTDYSSVAIRYAKQDQSTPVRSVQVVGMSERSGLIVVVLGNGTVQTEDLQGDNSGMVGEMSASDMSGEQNSGLGAVRPVPAFVTDRQGVLNASGSRYTYSTNTLAYFDAVGAGFEKIAIVGTGCQASIPAVMNARKAGKVGRRLVLSIGLLCSKTFDETMYEELFEAGYGIGRDSIAKVNIKGRFQVWMQDGSYAEVPLKEGRKWTREGCKLCPDFAAEHADVSAGGIGELAGWTILIIRTEAGKQLVDGAHGDGAIEIRPVTEDPSVIDLLVKLSRASRKRWPQDGSTYHEPGILPESVVS